MSRPPLPMRDADALLGAASSSTGWKALGWIFLVSVPIQVLCSAYSPLKPLAPWTLPVIALLLWGVGVPRALKGVGLPVARTTLLGLRAT